jgi:hypothetical protein
LGTVSPPQISHFVEPGSKLHEKRVKSFPQCLQYLSSTSGVKLDMSSNGTPASAYAQAHFCFVG